MNPVSRLAARGIALALAIVVLVAPAAAANAAGDAPDAAPVFVTTAVGPSAVGAYYSQQVAVDDDDARFALAAGAPSGMAITRDGFFEWVPAAPGSFDFAIVASNEAGTTVQLYTFDVAEAAALVPQQPQSPAADADTAPMPGDQVRAFAPDMQLPTLSEPDPSTATTRSVSASAPEIDPAIMTGSSTLVLLLLVGIVLLLRRQLAKA